MESGSMEVIKVKSVLGVPNNFTGIVKYPVGTQEWYLNGKLHRDDGPAIIRYDGEQYWYLKGKLHRKDGPAIIFPGGEQQWWFNGKLHCEDGPAIIFSSGRQEWYRNGECHRENGPAIISSNGSQEWYLNGVIMTPMEVFDQLSDEQKERVLWDLNQWK